MLQIIKLLILPFLLLSPSVLQALETVILTDESKEYAIGTFVEVFEDKEGEYTIGEVSAKEFEEKFIPHNRDIPRFKHSSSIYWFRFQIKNESKSNTEWFLKIYHTMSNRLDFYYDDGEGGFANKRMGTMFPFAERDVKLRFFVFPLLFSEQNEGIFYLRIDSGLASAIFPMGVMTKEILNEKSRSEEFVLALYLGIILVMIIYNFFIFLSVKEISYLYYVLFEFFLLLYFLCGHGFFLELFKGSVINVKIYASNLHLFMLFGLFFSRSFLNTKMYIPKLDVFLRVLICLILFNIPVSFLYSYELWIIIEKILFGPFLIGIITAGILTHMAGNRSARFFLLAWFAFIGSMIVLLLRFEGILTGNFISTYSIPLGSAIEAVLLSLALADRINFMKRDIENYSIALEGKVAEHRRMEEKYRSLIYEAGDAIVLTDLSGVVLEMNKAAEEVLGDRGGELTGRPLNDLFQEEGMEIFFDNPLSVKQRAINNRELTRPDGHRIMTDVSFSTIEFSDTKVIQCIIRDITKKKQEEEEKIKAQRLESLGVLAGGIAHDFNNMLTGVSNNINLVMLSSGKGESKIEGRLKKAQEAVFRAKGLAMQLLTFSKGGAPVRKPLSLVRTIRDAASLALRGSNVREEIFTEEGLWYVDADEGQMNQVLNNIVLNAGQSMTEGGVVEIRAENVSIEGGEEVGMDGSAYVKISIKDSGAGIEKDKLERIFDPYFTTREGGSGLGLATAYSIIKRHKGGIEVESDIGRGSLFTIRLPASKALFVPEEKEEGEVIVRGEGRVLLMDDDEMVRESLSAETELLGYETEAVRNGEEAVEIYRESLETKRPFHAVILDLTIRGGTGGVETLEKIREIDPEVKAIAISGYSNASVLANYREYGFYKALSKPFTLGELSRALH